MINDSIKHRHNKEPERVERTFKGMRLDKLKGMIKNEKPLLIDVRGMFDEEAAKRKMTFIIGVFNKGRGK